MSEFDQLEESLLFGSDADDCTIDPASLIIYRRTMKRLCLPSQTGWTSVKRG